MIYIYIYKITSIGLLLNNKDYGLKFFSYLKVINSRENLRFKKSESGSFINIVFSNL